MKTMPPSFEIRVALIGYVSVGKTTILNALLRDKYSEVSMKRTTAGVNLFRISLEGDDDDENKNSSKKQEAENAEESKEQESSTWTVDEEPVSAKQTLNEISHDNRILRDSSKIQEKVFDVKLKESFFEMRKSTKLVLVDIPGINEAGVNSKYKNYISENWMTFDCVIIVMDGRQGVNTEEQVELLKMARENCQKVKDISIVVVMNKIDDAEDEEQLALVDEARVALDRIFCVTGTSSKMVLDGIVTGATGARSKGSSHPPLLIPMSANLAFIYRTASSQSFDLFKEKIEKSLMDKLGKDAFGRQWRKFNDEEKMKKAYEFVCDPSEYRAGMEASNFSQFMSILSFCVGGAENQQWLLEHKISADAAQLSPDTDYVAKLQSLFDLRVLLGRGKPFCTQSAESEFRGLYRKSYASAFKKFDDRVAAMRCATSSENLMLDVSCFSKPMDEIVAYVQFLKNIGALDEQKKLEMLGLAKTLVLRQVEALFKLEEKDTTASLQKNSDSSSEEQPSTRLLTSEEWSMVFGALLRLARQDFFDDHFGILGVALERKFQQTCSDLGDNICKCGHRLNDLEVKCPKCKSYFSYVTAEEDRASPRPKKCVGCDSMLRNNGSCTRCARITIQKILPRKTNPMSLSFSEFSNALTFADSYEVNNNGLRVRFAQVPRHIHHYGHLCWRFGRLLSEWDLKDIGNRPNDGKEKFLNPPMPPWLHQKERPKRPHTFSFGTPGRTTAGASGSAGASDSTSTPPRFSFASQQPPSLSGSAASPNFSFGGAAPTTPQFSFGASTNASSSNGQPSSSSSGTPNNVVNIAIPSTYHTSQS
mmetsp:Transcript_30405/g.63470  ORF Transcript_30405/g.63470 Transcript_30405/m.63470 type:complete len:819 (-) Transcript_30405:70-2526(-)